MLPEEEMRKTHSRFYRPKSGFPCLILPLILLLWLAPLGSEAQETPEVEIDSVRQVEVIPPAPPDNVQAEDNPNDNGGIINISWERSADDGAGANNVSGYEILRSAEMDGIYEHIGGAAPGATFFSDSDVRNKVNYFYKVRAISPLDTSESLPSAAAGCFSKGASRG